MSELWNFEGKFVKIVDKSGDVVKGFVSGYERALDSDNGVASVDVICDVESNSGVFFYENQILSIEEINSEEVLQRKIKKYGKR